MAMNYTNVFGDQTVPPSGKSFRLIALTGHLSMHWGNNYEGDDYLASLNNVTASVAGWRITLPSAEQQSEGHDFIMRNVGLYAFQVDNYDGVPVAVIEPGDVKYFYLTDNTTGAGIWSVINFGNSTSAADANELKGPGLTVVAGRLAAAHPVISTSSGVTIESADRANVYAFVGGSVTLSLPRVLDVGGDFFIGVRNAGSGTVTIQPNGVDRIDDQSSMAIVPNESLWIYCTGATWYTVGYGRSTQFQFTKLVKDVTAGGTFTLTSAEASNKLLQFTGTPGSNVTVVLPAVVAVYYMQNSYTGAASITFKTPSGTGVTFNNSDRTILYCDGVNIVSATSTSVGSTINITDGTVTNPAWTFASDSDTGGYLAGPNTVGLAGGGVETARFAPTQASVPGNWGVGTTGPTAKMDVRGRGVFSTNVTAPTGGQPTGTVLQLVATDNQSTHLLLDTHGGAGGFTVFRTGVGTLATPAALGSLAVLGGFKWMGRGNTAWSAQRAEIHARTGAGWTDLSQGTAIVFKVTPDNSTAIATAMVIHPDGKISMGGDFTPERTVHIAGDLKLNDKLWCSRIALVYNNIPFVIQNNNVSTTDMTAAMIQLRNGDNGDADNVGFWAARAGYPFVVMNREGLLERFRVTNGGNAEVTGVYTTFSDERVKSNWKEPDAGFVHLLAGVLHGTFDMEGDSERRLGVGAQSLARVMPQAVTGFGGNDLFGVSYGNAALVAAVQLAKYVVALEQRISVLEQ